MSTIEVRYPTSDPVRYLAALDFVYSLLIQIADNVTQAVAESHTESKPIETETASPVDLGGEAGEAVTMAAITEERTNVLYDQSPEMPI